MVCEDSALYKCLRLRGRVPLLLPRHIHIEEETEGSSGVLESGVHLFCETSAQAISDLRGFGQIAQL